MRLKFPTIPCKEADINKGKIIIRPGIQSEQKAPWDMRSAHVGRGWGR